jgi:hypothetical protein
VDRRWFLGKVGSLLGLACAPEIVTAGVRKVEIIEPEIITDSGVKILLHQVGDAAPIKGSQGFGHGCIWQHVRTGEVWVNVGSMSVASWKNITGNPTNFLKMVLAQRLNQIKNTDRLGS